MSLFLFTIFGVLAAAFTLAVTVSIAVGMYYVLNLLSREEE